MLNELYQDLILDHGKNPRNFGKLAETTHSKLGFNPLCGDKITLYLNEKEGIITDASFEGTGCAISMASASMMLEAVKGKTVDNAFKFFDYFHALLTHGKGDNEENLGKLIAFEGVLKFPIRVKCATLPWHTLKAALKLNNDQKTISTE